MRPFLKPALVVLVLLLAGFAAVQRFSPEPKGVAEGSAAPAFRLASLAGGEVDLASLRGHVVVLNFWATWCPPCVAEMPSLDRLHRALAGEGLAVVAVSVDEDGAELRRFVAARGLALAVLRDPGGRRAAAAYGVEGYPVTFVVDPTGVVKERYDGPAEWDTPGALDHFRRELAGLPRPGSAR